MEKKFNLGDKVRFTQRDTKILQQQFTGQHRTRTITKIIYDPEMECNWYFLGSNNKGMSGQLSVMGLRSYQLKLATNTNKIGRPRIRHNKVLETTFSEVKIYYSTPNR